MIFECVVILAVHNYCHPYLRARANLAESVYLLVLCTLAIMQLTEDKQFEVRVEVLLVMLACHTLVVFLCKATHLFRNRFHCACARPNRSTRRRGYDEIESTATDPSLSIETQRRRSNLNIISQRRSQGLSSSRPPETKLITSDSSEESWEHAGQCLHLSSLHSLLAAGFFSERHLEGCLSIANAKGRYYRCRVGKKARQERRDARTESMSSPIPHKAEVSRLIIPKINFERKTDCQLTRLRCLYTPLPPPSAPSVPAHPTRPLPLRAYNNSEINISDRKGYWTLFSSNILYAPYTLLN